MRRRKIKFALELRDGEQARSMEELREHFDMEKIIGYFQDGKLVEWLDDRFYKKNSIFQGWVSCANFSINFQATVFQPCIRAFHITSIQMIANSHLDCRGFLIHINIPPLHLHVCQNNSERHPLHIIAYHKGVLHITSCLILIK